MKRKLRYIGFFLLLTAGFWSFHAPAVRAQSPSPSVQTSPTPAVNNPPIPDAATLSEFLAQVVRNFIAFRNGFSNTVEGTLGGYFSLIGYVLAFGFFIISLMMQFKNGEFNAQEIGKLVVVFVVCLVLMFYCSDVNGDGKRSDIIREAGEIGYSLAFNDVPSEPGGYYLARLVKGEQKTFNDNFTGFVENKLMVKIGENQMPVKYPGMQGVQTIAAVALGQGSEKDNESVMSQEFWIGSLFFIMNGLRTVIEIVDFFLIVSYSVGILLCSVIAPFMFCVIPVPEFRSRFTIPFLWAVGTITLVFPVMSQGFRYLAFLSANIALGQKGNPVYSYDAEKFTIIANSDPTPMILIAAFMMLLSIGFLAMSFILAYAFAQGRLLQAVNGLIANAFAGAASVGIGAGVSAVALRTSAEGEKKQIEGGFESSMTIADHNKQAQDTTAGSVRSAAVTSADGALDEKLINLQASRDAAGYSALGSLVMGEANIKADTKAKIATQEAGLSHNWENLEIDKQKAYADNLADRIKQDGDATGDIIAEQIRQQPKKAGLLAARINSGIGSVPVLNTLASTFGVNESSLNTWMRTKGFERIKGWVGDPQNGELGSVFSQYREDSMFDDWRKDTMATNKEVQGMPQNYQFPKMDGSDADGMSGQTSGQKQSSRTFPQFNRSRGTKSSPAPSAPQSSGRSRQQIASSLSGQGLATRSGDMTKTQRQHYANLQNLSRQDPNFIPEVQKMAKRNGWDANEILNTMAFESGFNKSIRGGDTSKVAGGNFVGLIQLGEAARQDVGLPRNVHAAQKQLSGMSATGQLKYVEKYLQLQERYSGTKLNKPGYVYGAIAVGAGGLKKAERNGGVAIVKGSREYNAGGNAQWDANRDGKITLGELSKVGGQRLGFGVHYDANKAIGKINAADPDTAELYGSLFSAESTYQNRLANNYEQYRNKNAIAGQYFTDKQLAEQGYSNNMIAIYRQQEAEQNAAVRANYGYQLGAADATFQGGRTGAQIGYQSSIKSADQIYGGSMQANQLTFEGQKQAAEITRKAQLENLYQRNMSNFTQSIGGSVAHQFSELFERASREH